MEHPPVLMLSLMTQDDESTSSGGTEEMQRKWEMNGKDLSFNIIYN